MNQIQWTLNAMPKSDDRYLSLMSVENVNQARTQVRLDSMAGRLGLGGL